MIGKGVGEEIVVEKKDDEVVNEEGLVKFEEDVVEIEKEVYIENKEN